jgi:adenylosuccinate synthase
VRNDWENIDPAGSFSGLYNGIVSAGAKLQAAYDTLNAYKEQSIGTDTTSAQKVLDAYSGLTSAYSQVMADYQEASADGSSELAQVLRSAGENLGMVQGFYAYLTVQSKAAMSRNRTIRAGNFKRKAAPIA